MTSALDSSTVDSATGAPAPPLADLGELRVGVASPSGRFDVVVPAAITPGALLELAGFPNASLVGPAGRALTREAGLGAQRVGNGALLIVAADAGDPPSVREERVEARSGGLGPLPTALVCLGALALAGLAAGWASDGSAPARGGIAALLGLAALVAALLPWRGALPSGVQVLAPAFAAAAVVALLPRAEPGANLVVIVAAAVVAAQAAALTRAIARPACDPALLVWLWSSVPVAGVAAAVLAGDGAPRVVWALLAVVAVGAARVLAVLVIDAPDEHVLDVDGMSATAWSVRSTGPRRRRSRLRAAQVTATVADARALLDAGSVAVAMVAAGCSVALALDPVGGWARWAAGATGIVVGVALGSTSRALRGALPRVVLRLGGAVAVLAGAGCLLAEAGDAALPAVAAGCMVLALLVLAAAGPLGRGWRSVWWGRLGDGLEALSVAGALPVSLLAAGAFDHFRAMTS